MVSASGHRARAHCVVHVILRRMQLTTVLLVRRKRENGLGDDLFDKFVAGAKYKKVRSTSNADRNVFCLHVFQCPKCAVWVEKASGTTVRMPLVESIVIYSEFLFHFTVLSVGCEHMRCRCGHAFVSLRFQFAFLQFYVFGGGISVQGAGLFSCICTYVICLSYDFRSVTPAEQAFRAHVAR